MTAHIRADLIRLRGRWDIWVVGFGVPVLAAIGFLQGYVAVPNHYGWDPSQPIPDYVLTAIATERATYAFPRSILTLMGNGVWLLIAAFFLTSTTIGLEFGWGTIRTSLLSSPDRRRMLASRVIVIGTVGIVLLASFIVLGVVLPGIIAATGNAPPASQAVMPIQIAGATTAVVVALGFVLALAALLAIVTRNPAVPFLIGLVYFILEGMVVNLGVWMNIHLDAVLDLLPVASVSALLRDSLDQTQYGIATADVTFGVVDRPLLLSVGVVVGWTLVFYLIADSLLRRADIVE